MLRDGKCREKKGRETMNELIKEKKSWEGKGRKRKGRKGKEIIQTREKVERDGQQG